MTAAGSEALAVVARMRGLRLSYDQIERETRLPRSTLHRLAAEAAEAKLAEAEAKLAEAEREIGALRQRVALQGLQFIGLRARRAGREIVSEDEALAHLRGYERATAIIGEVAADRRIGLRHVTGRSRSRAISQARAEACYRLAAETGLSLAAIGRLLNIDHSSVIPAVRAHARRNGLPHPRSAKKED